MFFLFPILNLCMLSKDHRATDRVRPKAVPSSAEDSCDQGTQYEQHLHHLAGIILPSCSKQLC